MPISFRHTTTCGEDAVRASFAPGQTLQTVEECREELLKMCEGVRRIVLDAGEVTELDLTFLQVVTALARTAATRGIHLEWADRPAPAVRDLAGRMGFAHTASPDGRFWLECPR